jgi:hypothetical protein
MRATTRAADGFVVGIGAPNIKRVAAASPDATTAA